MDWWAQYATYIVTVAGAAGTFVWYLYRKKDEYTDDRLNRQRSSIRDGKDRHQDLSEKLNGIEARLSDKIQKGRAETNQLRSEVHEEHKDMWREMSRKASKEELKLHRKETNQAIDGLRGDMNTRLDEMKDFINAKVGPIGQQVQAIYNHMLKGK